jgi:pimeloyl-ACP methyl ester carboxylesterase
LARALTSFVLVHGAWHGGWCWRHVVPRLQAEGHRVLTPTLTGQGERAHLLRPETGLATHVADILAVLDAEEPEDVVLVGHSYGARPSVFATAHPAVRRWVSLDGVAVVPGGSLLDGVPEDRLAAARAFLIGGIASPPLPPEAIGVPADHPLHAWVARRLTPMAWQAFADPLPPLPARFARLPRTYVTARDNRLDGPVAGLAQARREGWPVVEIASGHELMITAPAETAAALLALA